MAHDLSRKCHEMLTDLSWDDLGIHNSSHGLSDVYHDVCHVISSKQVVDKARAQHPWHPIKAPANGTEVQGLLPCTLLWCNRILQCSVHRIPCGDSTNYEWIQYILRDFFLSGFPREGDCKNRQECGSLCKEKLRLVVLIWETLMCIQHRWVQGCPLYL